MKKNIVFLLAVFALFVCLSAAHSAHGAPSAPVKTGWEVYDLPEDKYPDLQALLVFWIKPESGIYTYSYRAGSAGYPTRISLKTENGHVFEPRYPPDKVMPDPFEPEKSARIYEGPVPVFFPVPREVKAQGQASGTASFLLCSSKKCWPVNKKLDLDLQKLSDPLQDPDMTNWWQRWLQAAAPGAEKEPSRQTDLSADSLRAEYDFQVRSFTPGLEVSSLAKAAFLAVLAGLILNFMPCVLPVISLKLRGMIPDNAHDQDISLKKKAFRIHNLFFALGMLIFFSLLAVIISLTGMAWGQIFQNPLAIVVLSAVVFGLGLSLFGLYDLPVIDLKSGSGQGQKNSKLEALSTGMLATLLATPCSGPFLGGVLAWALTQPPAVIAFILFCVGLGMAGPYIGLAAFPFMVRFMPKPGRWTICLERGLGFLLMATCIYLITLLPETLVMKTLILFWVIAVGAWMWGRWTTLEQTALKRSTIRFSALVLVFAAAFLLFKPRQDYPVFWAGFDEQKFHELLGQENLMVEFTADWCPNCKFLEKTVLTPRLLADIEQKYAMNYMRVDLTYTNQDGEKLLRALDSVSIPLVAFFSSKEPDSPLILRDIFTRGQLTRALEQELE
ncbi:MAG: cytochrome c biogenesis protein CcdA [Desulfonatronovibrionaceae bacterium]